jgi:hypothetical protein
MPTARSLVAVARGKPASVIGSAGACAAFGPGLDGPEGGADGRLPCCLDLVGPPLARGREVEMLWDRATPLKLERSAAPDSRLMRAQQAVLELMAEGLHDDAIARGLALLRSGGPSRASWPGWMCPAGSPLELPPSGADGSGRPVRDLRRRFLRCECPPGPLDGGSLIAGLPALLNVEPRKGRRPRQQRRRRCGAWRGSDGSRQSACPVCPAR